MSINMKATTLNIDNGILKSPTYTHTHIKTHTTLPLIHMRAPLLAKAFTKYFGSAKYYYYKLDYYIYVCIM